MLLKLSIRSLIYRTRLTPEIEHFFDCVETGQKPQTDGTMARKVISLVLEAYRKAELEGANV